MINKLYDADYLKRLVDLFIRTKQRSYELLKLDPNDVLADIGCGTGEDALALGLCGATIYGIDHDPTMIATAELNQDSSLTIRYLSGDANHLPLEDKSVNKIRYDRVIQHLDDHDAVIREAKRVLRPEGMMQVIDSDYLGFTFFLEDEKFERQIIDKIAYSRIPNGHKVRGIPSVLRRHGFEIVHQEIHNYIIDDFELANYLVHFNTAVLEEYEAGRVSEENYKLWESQKYLPSGQFYFSFDLMLINAVLK